MSHAASTTAWCAAEAIQALGESNDPRAAAPLLAILAAGAGDDRDADVVQALTEISPKAAPPLLEDCAERNLRVRAGALSRWAAAIIAWRYSLCSAHCMIVDAQVRCNAATSLGTLGDVRAVPRLCFVARQ